MRVLVYGAEVEQILPDLERFPEFEVVEEAPEVVVCYGGDGTLLAAEREWPGVPKVPIRNSDRGNRCIDHPPERVLERLARGTLSRTEYMKLKCTVRSVAAHQPLRHMEAMNEVNVHMARINSAVRFRMWVDGEPYGEGAEVLGDGFVISTPFGSTAYFNHITRGFFRAGIGIAFKSTSEHTNHLVVPETDEIRVLITRGPAVMTYDNSTEFLDLYQGDEITVRRHEHPAVLLTWAPMPYPSDAF